MVTSRFVSEGNGACSTKTDEKFQNENGEESIYIRQVKAGFSFVQLKVGSMDINARIDSGAEITILSSKIFEQLKTKAPAKIKDVDLQIADKYTVLKGFIIQPLGCNWVTKVLVNEYMSLPLVMICYWGMIFCIILVYV